MLSVRMAVPTDNQALLALTAETPMAGLLPLIIDRQPDFFALQQLRGPGSVLVVEDEEQIVGTMNVTHLHAWSKGRKVRIDYLCDLKISPRYRGRRALALLLRGVRDLVMPHPPDAVLCVIARGNTLAEHVVSGRIGMPAFRRIDEFSVRQILPRSEKHQSSNTERYRIHESGTMDEPTRDFINQRFSQYALAPYVESSSDESNESRYLTAWDGSTLVGAMALLDTRRVKQNVVVALPWYLRLLKSVLNAAPRSWDTPRMPEIGEPIQMMYARLWAIAPGHEEALHAMIRRGRSLARQNQCHFFSIAACRAQDVLLKRYFSITFHSQLFGTTVTSDTSVLDLAEQGPVFEDFSLV